MTHALAPGLFALSIGCSENQKKCGLTCMEENTKVHVVELMMSVISIIANNKMSALGQFVFAQRALAQILLVLIMPEGERAHGGIQREPEFIELIGH